MRFTIRRPASAEVSPCCHRPSGGDVACGVDVGIATSSRAGFALEHRLALAVSGSDMPARRASLRRVRGRDLFDPTASLVLQTRSEHTPSASADTTIEGTLLGNPLAWFLYGAARTTGHRPHIQGFDANGVEAPCDVGGGLLDPVLAPIGLMRFQLRDRQLRAGSPIGAALGAGEPLLQDLQPLGLTTAQAWSMQQFAGRQCHRYDHSAIDTHHAALTRTSNGLRRVGVRDVPTAGSIAGDPVGLHPRGNRAREPKAHPTDFGYPHPTEPAVHTLDVVGFDPDLPKPLVHTGFAPRRTTVRPGEEVAHRLSEVPQCLLLHCLTPGARPAEHRTRPGQLRALLVVAGRTAPRRPVPLLLDSQVPHIPRVAAVLGQRSLLLGSRKQPVTRHPRNLTPTTDNTPKREAAFPPPAKARGFHAAPTR